MEQSRDVEVLPSQVSVARLINLYNKNLDQAIPEAGCWWRKAAFRTPVERKYYHEELRLEKEINELEEKLVTSEVKLSQKYEIERNELRKQLAQECSSSIDPMFTEFTHMELQKATNGFDPSLKIGEGAYGSMYKGFLRHTEVAIKLLACDCVQNHREFVEQVNCISKLRHPNLVTLVGACQRPWALVYEYLPGGPFIDRLKKNPPLPWQMRIRIAMDICSALIYLHSSKPICTAQSDLTLVKLLLDANFTCKITDFGVVSIKDTTPSGNMSVTTRFFKPAPEPVNVIPFILESDVYSFGIIVLQLLTGEKEALGIVTKVKYALSVGALDRILDPLAGEWPFVQAQQLAHMAVRCCDINNNNRPDLASDVWRVLAPMRRASSSSLSLFSAASRDNPPHYFICPILMETMKDPHFAADGFTYEAEAIRAWFGSGHNTSPMTNMKLTSLNLTPNRDLRSVIQDWLQLTSTK